MYSTSEIIAHINERFPDYPVSDHWLRTKRHGRIATRKTQYNVYTYQIEPILKDGIDFEITVNGYGRIPTYTESGLRKLIAERKQEIAIKETGKLSRKGHKRIYKGN